MNKIRLCRTGFCHLSDVHKSGNMVDVFGDVYVIRRYDFVSDSLFGYSPTLLGTIVWLWDLIIDWHEAARSIIVGVLEDHGYAYTPEGHYAVWGDIGQKPPRLFAVRRKKPLTWGDIRKAFSVNKWSDIEH